MFVSNVVRTLLLGQRLAASWGHGWKGDFSHSLIERWGLFCLRQGYQHVLYYTTSGWEDRTRLVLFLAYWHVRTTQAIYMCFAAVSCEIGASFSAHFVKGWLDCIMHIHLLMVGHLHSNPFPQKCLIAADHDLGCHPYLFTRCYEQIVFWQDSFWPAYLKRLWWLQYDNIAMREKQFIT